MKDYSIASSIILSFLLCVAPYQATALISSSRFLSSTPRSFSSVVLSSAVSSSTSSLSSPWFSSDKSTQEDNTVGDRDDDKNGMEKETSRTSTSQLSLDRLKVQILQLGAALDRGQAYNPTSGDYYNQTIEQAKEKITQMVQTYPKLPKSLQDIDGEWELVLTTVKHGIFRSSPFFLAIQESYEYAEEKESFGVPKADLFFKLHELQTCSWGVSKIGRVAQTIDASKNYLYSEFDTSIFSLTVIPILGWFKLLPTFGGSVVTAATCNLEQEDEGNSVLLMEVDYTTSRKVPGLEGIPLIGDWIWKVKVPVGMIWKLLPWNQGRPATCKVYVRYVDDDFRIVEDISGDYFVYTRPVVSRPFKDVE